MMEEREEGLFADGQHHEVDITTDRGNGVLELRPSDIHRFSNNDHVGFIDNRGEKAFVGFVGKSVHDTPYAVDGYLAMNVKAFNVVCNCVYGRPQRSISEALDFEENYVSATIERLFVFETRKQLLQWLAD